MNSANCAYHRLLPLVLIAAVTIHLERRWALHPGAQHRQVIFVSAPFLCQREGNAVWGMSGGLLEQNVRTRQAITDSRTICYYTLSIHQGQIKNSLMFTFKLFLGFHLELRGKKGRTYACFKFYTRAATIPQLTQIIQTHIYMYICILFSYIDHK